VKLILLSHAQIIALPEWLAILRCFHSDWALCTWKLIRGCNPVMARRLSTFLMKRTRVIISVVALMIGVITPFSLNAQDKESAEARNARYDQLKDQISDYYAVDSPWTRASDFELEGTLFHLMGAEVRVWQLTDNLRDRNDPNAGEASSAGTLLHEEILEIATKALSRLRARPNPRLLKLLITHLETYPYSWTEEGYEDLLPNLQKLQNTRKHDTPRSGDR
jgi:hypothetical protein